jgi:hypothetical protein
MAKEPLHLPPAIEDRAEVERGLSKLGVPSRSERDQQILAALHDAYDFLTNPSRIKHGGGLQYVEYLMSENEYRERADRLRTAIRLMGQA